MASLAKDIRSDRFLSGVQCIWLFSFFGGGHVCVLFKNKNSSSYFFFFLQSNKIEIDPETLIFCLPFSPLPRSHSFPSGPEGLNFLEACGSQSISGSCDGPWRSVSSLGPSRCCFLLSFLLETVGCLWGKCQDLSRFCHSP